MHCSRQGLQRLGVTTGVSGVQLEVVRCRYHINAFCKRGTDTPSAAARVMTVTQLAHSNGQTRHKESNGTAEPAPQEDYTTLRVRR